MKESFFLSLARNSVKTKVLLSQENKIYTVKPLWLSLAWECYVCSYALKKKTFACGIDSAGPTTCPK